MTFFNEENENKYVERVREQAEDMARFVEQSMKDEQSGKKLYYQPTSYIQWSFWDLDKKGEENDK